MAQMQRLVGGLLLCLVCSCLLSLFVLTALTPPCPCNEITDAPQKVEDGDDPSWGPHKLAVIVPFRDRFDELLKFAPHIHRFLSRQQVRHKVYIVNQADQHRFNRASLINVGHLLSRDECDYLAMHDVDLLPLNPQLSYAFPNNGPFHVASPEFHPKYHYATFVGGILVLTREQFEKVNGLSNKYWGWGLEDDEFYARLKEAKLNVSRPLHIATNRQNTFLHLHDRRVRKRDTARLFNQREVTRRRDRATGLDTVQYELLGQHELVIDGAPVTVYDVKLVCDYTLTPWCDNKTAATPRGNDKRKTRLL